MVRLWLQVVLSRLWTVLYSPQDRRDAISIFCFWLLFVLLPTGTLLQVHCLGLWKPIAPIIPPLSLFEAQTFSQRAYENALSEIAPACTTSCCEAQCISRNPIEGQATDKFSTSFQLCMLHAVDVLHELPAAGSLVGWGTLAMHACGSRSLLSWCGSDLRRRTFELSTAIRKKLISAKLKVVGCSAYLARTNHASASK